MGRIIFLLLLFLFSFAAPVFAAPVSHDIRVTATVLPSPGWISLLRANSSVAVIDIPYLDFLIYQLRLGDGRIPIRRQPVTADLPPFYSSTGLTDDYGQISFTIPRYASANPVSPRFFYSVTGTLIPLN